MAKGRAVAIVLEDEEKRALTALTRKPAAPQAIAKRARIVLAAADGLKNKEIGEKLQVCAHTVSRWRNRFADTRMDGLYDEPRPEAPRQIGDDEIAALIRKTLETRPEGAMHWSLRTMAKEIGHAPSTVPLDHLGHLARLRLAAASRRDLQAVIRPLKAMLPQPSVVEKVRDIVGPYLSPPERVLVLCVDESEGREASNQVSVLNEFVPFVPIESLWLHSPPLAS